MGWGCSNVRGIAGTDLGLQQHYLRHSVSTHTCSWPNLDSQLLQHCCQDQRNPVEQGSKLKRPGDKETSMVVAVNGVMVLDMIVVMGGDDTTGRPYPLLHPSDGLVIIIIIVIIIQSSEASLLSLLPLSLLPLSLLPLSLLPLSLLPLSLLLALLQFALLYALYVDGVVSGCKVGRCKVRGVRWGGIRWGGIRWGGVRWGGIRWGGVR